MSTINVTNIKHESSGSNNVTVNADGTTNIGNLNELNVAGNQVINTDGRIISNEDLPTVKPTLNLDFANSKTLDPRIDFTRSSTATYWDGKTTAKAEENLQKYSQDIGIWSNNTNSTVVSDSVVAPDGTTTADEITFTSGSSSWVLEPDSDNLQAGKTYTISCWVKAPSAADFRFISFTSPSLIQSSVFNATTSWVRYTWTTSSSNSGGNGTGFRGVTAGATIHVWGYQVEERDSVTAYTPTTSSPITRYQPVLQTASANQPRFDHDPVTGESKGLLIEEQRTNGFADSTMFASGWSKFGTSSSYDNTTIAPDATVTAGTIADATDMNFGGNSLQKTFTGDNYVTASVYFKATASNGATTASIGIRDGVSGSTSTQALALTGDWQRVSVTRNLSGSRTDHRVVLGGADGDFHVWGLQVEEGSFPTSYIPTSGSQVTRAGDKAQITDNNFLDWYNQEAGSMFTEHETFVPNNGNHWVYSFNGTNSSASQSDIDQLRGRFRVDPDVWSSADINTLTMTDNTWYKIASAYEDNTFASSGNGGTAGTDTDGYVKKGTNKLILGDRGDFSYTGTNLNGHIKKFTYYPARLPNATLQAMTEE